MAWRKIWESLSEWSKDPSALDPAPTTDIIHRAMRFVVWCHEHELVPPDRVVSSSEGGVVFEWWGVMSLRYIEMDPTGDAVDAEYDRGEWSLKGTIEWQDEPRLGIDIPWPTTDQ